MAGSVSGLRSSSVCDGDGLDGMVHHMQLDNVGTRITAAGGIK